MYLALCSCNILRSDTFLLYKASDKREDALTGGKYFASAKLEAYFPNFNTANRDSLSLSPPKRV